METSYIFSIVAACAFLAGIIFTAIAYVLWQRVRGFVQTAEQVEGTVIEPVKSGALYVPVVEFTDRFGQRREHRGSMGTSWQRFAVGDKVQVLYEQNDPDSTKINHWLDLYFWSGLWFVEAVSAFFLAVVFTVTWFVL